MSLMTKRAAPGCPALLEALAEQLSAKVRRGTTMLLRDTLTHVLRAEYREHKVEILANEEIVLLDVEARYGPFSLMVINPSTRFRAFSRPLQHRAEVAGVAYRIDPYGELSPAQSRLLASGAVGRILPSVAKLQQPH